ncbi:glycosyltransferase family protein [Protaetiibacter mangrovi]|uniref:Glycosyltransferase n=1 Tax=Protaetiibacter mangrovi TaxID=2970926 RepID=A0ABT1ZFK5_9MICO|nr:glycosyltransferase [Protaetiibacter mangrovi]MCS0499477.1 glycosyltransferase [Protaetiibacter mangrovi]TPX05238.1 glycosyltransferase [Schumannella luteola]
MRNDAIAVDTARAVRTDYLSLLEGRHRTGVLGTLLFCVSSTDISASKGDLYVALGLARALRDAGWGVSFWDVDHMAEQTPDDVDVAVVMLESWVPGFIHPATKAVAWVRNWTTEWASLPYLDEFAEIWCSSNDAAERLSHAYEGTVRVVPLATDPELFDDPSADRTAGVVTTANYWGVERQIQTALEHVSEEVPVAWYGVNSDFLTLSGAIDKRDHVDYFELPGVYGSWTVVVDDLIEAAAQFGTQNSRLFDALASGAMVVTNAGRGLDELGLGDVPVYSDPQGLLEIVLELSRDPDATAERVARLRERVLELHTWAARAHALLEPLAGLRALPGSTERSPMLVWTTRLRDQMRRDRRAHDDYAELYFGAIRDVARLDGEVHHLTAVLGQRRYRAADVIMKPLEPIRRRSRD